MPSWQRACQARPGSRLRGLHTRCGPGRGGVHTLWDVVPLRVGRLDAPSGLSFTCMPHRELQNREEGGQLGARQLLRCLPAKSARKCAAGRKHLQHLCPIPASNVSNAPDAEIYKPVKAPPAPLPQLARPAKQQQAAAAGKKAAPTGGGPTGRKQIRAPASSSSSVRAPAQPFGGAAGGGGRPSRPPPFALAAAGGGGSSFKGPRPVELTLCREVAEAGRCYIRNCRFAHSEVGGERGLGDSGWWCQQVRCSLHGPSWDHAGRSVCLASLPCEVDTPSWLLVRAWLGTLALNTPPQAVCPLYQHHPTPKFTGGGAGNQGGTRSRGAVACSPFCSPNECAPPLPLQAELREREEEYAAEREARKQQAREAEAAAQRAAAQRALEEAATAQAVLDAIEEREMLLGITQPTLALVKGHKRAACLHTLLSYGFSEAEAENAVEAAGADQRLATQMLFDGQPCTGFQPVTVDRCAGWAVAAIAWSVVGQLEEACVLDEASLGLPRCTGACRTTERLWCLPAPPLASLPAAS